MSFSSAQVAQQIANVGGVSPFLGQGTQLGSPGQSEGGGVASQVAAAIAWWNVALALGTLSAGDTVLANAEVIRLTALIEVG